MLGNVSLSGISGSTERMGVYTDSPRLICD